MDPDVVCDVLLSTPGITPYVNFGVGLIGGLAVALVAGCPARSQSDESGGMVCIWMISGKQLPTINLSSGIRNAEDVKLELHKQHGFPLHSQQLLHDGSIMHDFDELDSSVDMHPVLTGQVESHAFPARQLSCGADVGAHPHDNEYCYDYAWLQWAY